MRRKQSWEKCFGQKEWLMQRPRGKKELGVSGNHERWPVCWSGVSGELGDLGSGRLTGPHCRALSAAVSEQWEPGRVLSRGCCGLIFSSDCRVDSSSFTPSPRPLVWLIDN